MIAPGYEPEALEILKAKKNGNYNIIQIDSSYEPALLERKQVFGVTLEQGHNNLKINRELLSDLVTENKDLPEAAVTDLLISLITLKYTQSNSVCYVKDGQAIGIGAGQQSRVHCTRLAGGKADNWYLRQSPQVMNLPFKEGIKGQTVTMPLMCIWERTIWTCWQTDAGRISLQRNRLYLQERKRGPGWIPSQAYHSGWMPFSPLATTLTGPTKAA